jgi:hypothetical protein
VKTLALVLSLLAIGVLGLVACGGDDETTAGSETKGAGEERTPGSEEKAAKDEPASKKSCGKFGRWRLRVEGDVSCSRAHRVMRGEVHQGAAPRPWTCSGPDDHIDCTKDEPGIVIKARF